MKKLFFSAAPRFELPENYNDGLIFRHDEVIRLRVPMIAKPAPKVVWFFEDEPISAGTDLTIETTDSFTSLRIQGAKRWHCGEFRVYAENEYGEDACSILVTVTCKFLRTSLLHAKIAVFGTHNSPQLISRKNEKESYLAFFQLLRLLQDVLWS